MLGAFAILKDVTLQILRFDNVKLFYSPGDLGTWEARGVGNRRHLSSILHY